jgi:hypothetical protein
MASTHRWRLIALSLLAIGSLTSAPASAAERSLYLFGGPEHEEFLGCISCYTSTVFSIWNGAGDYGSTTHPNSIWNQNGKFGARTSLLSPWNTWATQPPIVVDRNGNFYGYFTRNPDHPGRITSMPPPDAPHTENELEAYAYLAWLLDDYEAIIANLEHVRADQMRKSHSPAGR